MTDEETMAAFIELAAKTGCVMVARDVYDILKRLPRPESSKSLGAIEISVSDYLEPGTMVAVQDFKKIPSLDIRLFWRIGHEAI